MSIEIDLQAGKKALESAHWELSVVEQATAQIYLSVMNMKPRIEGWQTHVDRIVQYQYKPAFKAASSRDGSVVAAALCLSWRAKFQAMLELTPGQRSGMVAPAALAAMTPAAPAYSFDAATLIARIESSTNVRLSLDENDRIVARPAGRLPEQTKEQIRRHAGDLVRALKQPGEVLT